MPKWEYSREYEYMDLLGKGRVYRLATNYMGKLAAAHNADIDRLESEITELKEALVETDAYNGAKESAEFERNLLATDYTSLEAERDEWKDKERVTSELFEAACNDLGAAQERIAALEAKLERPVKVRCHLEPEDISKMVNRCHADGYNQLATCKKVMDYVLLNAVIDVPAGVPSVEELHAMYWGREHTEIIPGMTKDDAVMWTAIRNATLASLPVTTPHEPTDAEMPGAAGPWRTDVENAEFVDRHEYWLEYTHPWYPTEPDANYRGALEYVANGDHFTHPCHGIVSCDRIVAFAIPNPPQKTGD